MNTEIARIIKVQIENLPFMEKVGGLVRVIKKVDSTDKGTTTKTFPVDCDVSEKECSVRSKYTDLVPNSNYKSVHFFEDLGVTISTEDQATFSFESKVKLIGWLNLQKLGKTECSVSHLAIASILKSIESRTFNSGDFTKMQIRCTGIDPKSAEIFRKYTFSEEATQYLMYPYDYYAMTFTTKFTIPYKCITDWQSSLPINCLNDSE